MAYSDKVIDHYSNPRNVGSFGKDTPGLGTGLVGAPECGDVMKLQIKVNLDTGVIEDAKFKTFGCGSAIASSSLATEWLKGKTVEEALAIKNTDIVTELSLPPVKIHCSVLAEDAIKAAIGDGSALGLRVTYIRQDEPLGLAHCVLIADDFLGDDDFVMYLGDNVLADGIVDAARTGVVCTEGQSVVALIAIE